MRIIKVRPHIGAALAFGALACSPTGALAQTSIAPLVAGEDPEYEPDPLTVGPFRLSPQIVATTVYDDNVIANPDGAEIEDVEFIVRPEMVARLGDRNIGFTLEGYGEFSRFADFTSEDSDTYGVSGDFSYSPSVSSRLNVGAGYARIKEDRGDPEARDIAGPGPRLVDSTFANVSYRRAGGRLLVALEAGYDNLDAISPIDDDRDFETFAGRATAGYRVSGPVYATVTGFVNYRDFRLEGTLVNPDRDATTYGGQVGLSFVESERLTGRARLGLFRFEPNDPTLDARTGFSADVSLTYLPTRRTALIFEAFNGDVATFRQGAIARTDTRVSLTGQFEVRHNLYARAGGRWIRNRFVGSGIDERILRSNAALEFLAGRGLSFVAEVQVSDRTSDDPTQVFDRFQASLGARFRF
ncbi:MAG: outer membrane beta-barrel protein [Erythrobacter sp.]|uniref:outer membrane beta-barrel protein n=1 Tax=Erythrobacter sp. TaxID=1042 RepID=UPI00260CF17F|nr:outer membrane beta-barrel protein [Erythrobacter sp.]MDJ0978689.1 outer membrane beta-barrel protein [Erythrobacter sp.]